MRKTRNESLNHSVYITPPCLASLTRVEHTSRCLHFYDRKQKKIGSGSCLPKHFSCWFFYLPAPPHMLLRSRNRFFCAFFLKKFVKANKWGFRILKREGKKREEALVRFPLEIYRFLHCIKSEREPTRRSLSGGQNRIIEQEAENSHGWVFFSEQPKKRNFN